jgi:L-threonylcarbamoyladenylate synthase
MTEARAPHPHIFKVTDAVLEGAAGMLRGGGLVAFATETVYGLGANACRDDAVARLFAAKNRPRFNPLIVHVPDTETARTLADFDPLAERLAAAFWPGPLTLVLPKRAESGLSPLVSAGLDTVALRVPAPETARAFLGYCRRPVAAPSANPSGRLSPTTAQHVADAFPDMDLPILDAGPCATGLESTVVGGTGTVPTCLRAGGLALDAIEAVIGAPLIRADLEADDAAPASPGRLLRHYAPLTPVRADADRVAADEVWIGFGPGPPPGAPKAAFNLSPAGDVTEAAANLFRVLHEADAVGATAIAVAPVPDDGLGVAVNDRLRRAQQG